MRPLISYYGGKQRMASKIVPLIPPHTVYCEPFAGGAAVFFAKPKPEITNGHHYREALNDINGDLVNLYSVVQSSPYAFKHTVCAIPYSAAMHRGAQKSQQTPESRAVSFFLNNQHSFANVSGGGWATACVNTNHADSFNTYKKNMLAICRRLDGVYIDSSDAIECIRRWDSPHTFFYVDPPYANTNIKGMGQWSVSDLKRLTDCLNMISGSYIVSGYDEHAHHLRGSTQIELRARCTASCEGKTLNSSNKQIQDINIRTQRIEVVWMRGPAAPVRKSLIPILEKQACFTGPLLGPCPLPLKR